MLTTLFELTTQNLHLDFTSESVGLLFLGVGLTACAVTLRRVFNRRDENRQSSGSSGGVGKLAKKIN